MPESPIQVTRAFIGAGCNRTVKNVSWGPCNLVAFGAQNAVVIFCPETAQILTTAPGHTSTVNCTYWLPSNKHIEIAKRLKQHYLISGAADGVVLLWEWSVDLRQIRHVLPVPKSPKKGVTCISGIVLSDTDAVFASTSSDASIHLWRLSFPCVINGGGCSVCHLQSFSVGSMSMVSISLAELPGNGEGELVLATGGLDNKVHLYTGRISQEFVHACELRGHADWVRDLDFSVPPRDNNGGLLLVSCSQDKSIRIWKVVRRGDREVNCRTGLSSYIEGPSFVAGSSLYQSSLESLLTGHEDWVYSVEWQPGSPHHSILSASMDKMMMIWQPERGSHVWTNVVTVGELNHSSLGFYGGRWSPSGNSILAHAYGGSFHLWSSCGGGNWEPQKVPSGHHDAVTDIAWDRFGDYLLSVSRDQTCRVFCRGESLWHEIARPQVHGHDIHCVCAVQGPGPSRFVSGADEKVARVFEAPSSFLKALNLNSDLNVLGAANMSALGLSQKPVHCAPPEVAAPVVEEQLAWHSLWPESHKLYGHGNELFSLSCNHAGTLLASSCKARTEATAEVCLWEVGTWRLVGKLKSHRLTVTAMEFSHDDRFLLTVSRDRKFSVFSIADGDGGVLRHRLVVREDDAHARIIWACCWNPHAYQFVTGSRDRTVKLWALEGDDDVRLMMELPPFGSGVTALSWSGGSPRMLLAVGMDSGLIELWHIRVSGIVNVVPALRLDPVMCHVAAVHRLMWRTGCGGDGDCHLASCGADHAVRIFRVQW